MRRSTSLFLAACLLASATFAQAQSVPSDKWSVSASAGLQLQSRDVNGAGTYSIYEEDASFTSLQTLESDLAFEFSVDYRVRKNLALGVGWNFYSTEGPMTVSANVPHPLFVGQMRTAAVEADGVNHRTQAININASWRYPLSRKMDVVVSAGPSILMVKQDLLTGLSIGQETFPFTAPPTVSSITVTGESKTTVGFNAGADAVYMMNPRYGFGAGFRYIYGSVDFDAIEDSLTVGGFQILGGFRARF